MAGFLARRRSAAARAVILNELEAGETILAEGTAPFMFSDGTRTIWPEALLVVTDKRLIWTLVKKPDAGAPFMRFSRLVNHEDDGDRFALTERDEEYAASLDDPTNPYGETDAVFQLGSRGESRPLREAITKGIAAADRGSGEVSQLESPILQEARRIVRGEIHPQETVRAEGPIRDLLLELPAFAVVTEDRILWATGAEPPRVMFINFSEVREMAQREPSLRLTAESGRPPSSHDGGSEGRRDGAEILCPKSEVFEAIQTGVKRLSPSWQEWRDSIQRFASRRDTPVEGWPDCPLCQGPIDERTEHVIRCSTCFRFYSDAGFQPVVGAARADWDRPLAREAPWRPLFETQLHYAGKTLAWIPPPPYFPADQPIQVVDSETNDAADGEFYRWIGGSL
jgi:hypothetical protein